MQYRIIFNNLINKIERQREKIRNIVKHLFEYLIHYRFSIVKVKGVNDNIKNVKIEIKEVIDKIAINELLSKKIIIENEKRKGKKKKIVIKKVSSNSFKGVENNIKNVIN